MIRKLVQKLFKQDKVTELADLIKKEYLTIFQHLKNEGIIPQNYEPPELEVIGKLKFFKNYYLKVERIPYLFASLFPILSGMSYSIYLLLFKPFSADNIFNVPNIALSFPLLSFGSLALYLFFNWIKGVYLDNERKIQIVGTKNYLKNKRKMKEIIIHESCHDIVGKDESKTEACRVFVQYCLENEKEEFLKELKKEATIKNPYNLIKRIIDPYYKGRLYAFKVISNNRDINLKMEIEKLKNLKSV